MNLFDEHISHITSELCAAVAALPEAERIESLNAIRAALHEVSPFRDEPVDCVQWVPVEDVTANDYNPNTVAPPEMRLLAHSIEQDGYTQPVVTCANGERVIVDGFHRRRVCAENPRVRERVHGYLPVTTIRGERDALRDRMAATIRHNRARGVHGVLPMVEVVATLIRQGWNDDEVARELGMDADEVLRFKQAKGLPELFRDTQYSRAWE